MAVHGGHTATQESKVQATHPRQGTEGYAMLEPGPDEWTMVDGVPVLLSNWRQGVNIILHTLYVYPGKSAPKHPRIRVKARRQPDNNVEEIEDVLC